MVRYEKYLYSGNFTAKFILIRLKKFDVLSPAGKLTIMNLASPSFDHTVTAPVAMGRSARARAAILRALDDLGDPAGASRIAEMLDGSGVQLRERAIRFHLLKMDREGLTKCLTKHDGRQITETGRKELARLNVMQRVGFVSSKMDELGFRMSLKAGTDEIAEGTVIANFALIDKQDLSRTLHFMKPVFSAGLCMGDRIAVSMSGGKLVESDAPRGMVGIATVCSMTINGFFLKHGIPVVSRFGGLVEMDHGTPKRFTEVIEYKGTSIDPQKLFIASKMTKVGQYAATGSGVIGVSFREFPSVAIDKARDLVHRLRRMNMNGVLLIGQPNRPLLDIPVGDGRTGMIAFGGLNPVAAAIEAGIPVELYPLSGLEEVKTFVPFSDVARLGRRVNYVE